MSCPSATLAVWTSAWLSGSAAADDVLDAMRTWAEQHDVVTADDDIALRLNLPGPHGRPTSLALLLAALRREGARSGRVVLPVPGDVRGLGDTGAFAAAALDAEEAVVLADAGLGLVPIPAAEGVLRWTVFVLPLLPPVEFVGIGEAEHSMTDAVREAVAALVSLDVARHRPGVREEIAAAVRASTRASWPAGAPQRAVRVLQRATEVGAILRAATADPVGGALSASAAQARDDVLRPLSHQVRTAVRASVDEAVRVLTDSADHH